MDSKPSPNNPAHDLAVKIYVELVARNTELEEGKVRMAASAANIAALSLKLAETFLQAEAEAIAAKEPVKDYKLQSDVIANWSKP